MVRHYGDRAVRVVHHLLSERAEQDTRHAVHSLGADDDQACLDVVSRVEQRPRCAVAVHDHLLDGDTGVSLVEAVLPQMKKKYGSWHLFDYFSKRNIADVEAELNNTKHIPSAQH